MPMEPYLRNIKKGRIIGAIENMMNSDFITLFSP